MPEYIFRLV